MLGSRVGIDPASEDPKATEDWETKLQALVDRMTSERRSAFLALADVHSTKEDGSCGKLVGILRTNGICLPGYFRAEGSGEGDGVDETRSDCFAVGELISRINHSCAPNVIRKWENSSFSFCISAIRPIAKGEELIIAYISIALKTAKRFSPKPINSYANAKFAQFPLPLQFNKHANNIRMSRSEATEWAVTSYYSTSKRSSKDKILQNNLVLIYIEQIENAGLQACDEYKVLITLVALYFINNKKKEEARIQKYAVSYMELANARFIVREVVEEGITLKFAEVDGYKLRNNFGTISDHEIISYYSK